MSDQAQVDVDISAKPIANNIDSSLSCGVANIPNQVHYLASRRPVQFNVLALGEAALGKTTMLNSILGFPVFSNAIGGNIVSLEQYQSHQIIRVRRQELDERGIRVQLGILDVPELGQSLRKKDIHEQVTRYVHEQHLRWLHYEAGPKRDVAQRIDSRIHITLYFLNPNNHRLSELDLTLIRRLSELTNVILVISKADTLLRHELHRIKYNVRDQVRAEKIKLFRTPDLPEAEPFVCLNGDEGQQAVGRTYPWGFVRRTQSNAKLNANSGVNELSALLFRSYLPHLQERVDELYEETRAAFLAGVQQHGTAAEQLAQVTAKLDELILADKQQASSQ